MLIIGVVNFLLEWQTCLQHLPFLLANKFASPIVGLLLIGVANLFAIHVFYSCKQVCKSINTTPTYSGVANLFAPFNRTYKIIAKC